MSNEANSRISGNCSPSDSELKASDNFGKTLSIFRFLSKQLFCQFVASVISNAQNSNCWSEIAKNDKCKFKRWTKLAFLYLEICKNDSFKKVWQHQFSLRKHIPRTLPHKFCCLPFNIAFIKISARIPSPMLRALRVCLLKFRAHIS